MRAEAVLTTTGRSSTTRCSGPGKQDGKVYVRNQRLKASQGSHQLKSGGYGLGSNAHRAGNGVGTSGSGDVANQEAMVKVYGVAMAMLQGHSWAPTLSIGSTVNVGTILMVPPSGGKVRCRLMLWGWGGGPVVVRGRESRSHGEGVQCVCSNDVSAGARW